MGCRSLARFIISQTSIEPTCGVSVIESIHWRLLIVNMIGPRGPWSAFKNARRGFFNRAGVTSDLRSAHAGRGMAVGGRLWSGP